MFPGRRVGWGLGLVSVQDVYFHMVSIFTHRSREFYSTTVLVWQTFGVGVVFWTRAGEIHYLGFAIRLLRPTHALTTGCCDELRYSLCLFSRQVEHLPAARLHHGHVRVERRPVLLCARGDRRVGPRRPIKEHRSVKIEKIKATRKYSSTAFSVKVCWTTCGVRSNILAGRGPLPLPHRRRGRHSVQTNQRGLRYR